MSLEIALDDAFERIMDKGAELLTDEARPGRALQGINTVVRGDKDLSPRLPAIWIYAEPLTNEHLHTLKEKWTLPMVVAVTVEDNNPTRGYRATATYAAAARRVLIRSRRLGLDAFVQDVQSARFEASQPWSRRGNLYDAIAVMNVIFTVWEP